MDMPHPRTQRLVIPREDVHNLPELTALDRHDYHRPFIYTDR